MNTISPTLMKSECRYTITYSIKYREYMVITHRDDIPLASAVFICKQAAEKEAEIFNKEVKK